VRRKSFLTINGIKQKGRLLAWGCSPRQGIDCEETFSPVVRYRTKMLLTSLAVQMNVTIDHMDVVMTSLYADLSETVYVRKLEGFPKHLIYFLGL
jgi:hypothetical protein